MQISRGHVVALPIIASMQHSPERLSNLKKGLKPFIGELVFYFENFYDLTCPKIWKERWKVIGLR